jgi:hypothetical protein
MQSCPIVPLAMQTPVGTANSGAGKYSLTVYVAMRRRINNVDGLAADGECQPSRGAKGLITVSTRIPRRMMVRWVDRLGRQLPGRNKYGAGVVSFQLLLPQLKPTSLSWLAASVFGPDSKVEWYRHSGFCLGGSIKSPENHLAFPLSADSMSPIRQKAGYGRDTRIYARSAR